RSGRPQTHSVTAVTQSARQKAAYPWPPGHLGLPSKAQQKQETELKQFHMATKGLFTLPEGPHFIQPVQGSTDGAVEREGPEPHVVYPSVTTVPHRYRRSSEARDTHSPCGVRDAPGDSLVVEREREDWEREQQEEEREREEETAQHRSQRSVSRERWVETMVVADSKLIDYHGSDNVESYIFTIMNMKGLKIIHHADTSLASFCAWQKNLNPLSDTHPAHHDVAVLVTRKDICAGLNEPCETLGLSHLSGMCQPHRSCNINEDSGLPVAFTIAHELGHSFGIHHDGQGNDCEMDGRHPFIMSRQLMYDTSPLTWSSCSKDYITRFLDRGWGFCLDDRPSKKDLTTPLARLGVRYTTQHQCQLQYGPNATYCHEIDNVCQILWCSVNGSCRSKLDSPIDGTRCGPEKWCISGECVIIGKLPETVNGNWGQWSSWSHCSRTCGAGVKSAHRECNHPKPEFGGKYCTGERRRYHICNTKPCQKAKPTFRDMLCSEFDTVPYQNELYEWVPVASLSSPCELHCRPVDEHFSEKMLDAVTDGTPCFMNNNSRSICVNGVCKEMEEAGNFLALRGQGSEEYFLNGQYIIQWNGEYKAGGTTFYYERSGNLENLTSPGPTKQPVMIQLLYQEKNPGIKYEYTIKRNRQTGNEVIRSEYRWRHGAWTDCSTTCGLGKQHQPVRCFELEVGVVDEAFCDPESRPEDQHRKCKNMDCPASHTELADLLLKQIIWLNSNVLIERKNIYWTKMYKKGIIFMKDIVNKDCKIMSHKQLTTVYGGCPVTCGGSVRTRTVTCLTAPPKKCDNETMPRSKSLCALQSCPSKGLRRRPGPPPKYRRIYLPKRHPTRQPVTHTWGPKSTSTTTTPRTSTVTVTERTTTPITTSTTKPFPPSSTATDIIDVDDYEFNLIVVKNGHVEDKDGAYITTSPTETENREMREKEEEDEKKEEEGSAADFLFPDSGVTYTPGYDYVVEDVTTEEEGLTDLDIFTTETSLGTPNQSPPIVTTTGLHPTSTPHTPHTSVPTTSHTTPHTTRVPLTTSPSTPQTSTAHWAMNTSHYPLTPPNTTPSINPFTKRTTRMEVFWVVGNWSECSTSCGLGAMWRPVLCSSQHESDCANLKRPEPARTCHLRPCATWLNHVIIRTDKCPKGCEVVGRRQRDVQCVDGQKGRPLRPFHCQVLCGGGLRERLVYCPEAQHCSATQRPNDTETCNLQPCSYWDPQDWEECSVSCGEGLQHRVVRCVVEDTGSVENSPLCRKNSMSSRFCDKLKLLGRCSLRSIQKQCCVTCR
ncbi:unnamed protein product, partial [Coregonus sp. 'balchen']